LDKSLIEQSIEISTRDARSENAP